MLVANAVVDTDQPRLQVGENQMDDRQVLLGNLWITTLGNSEVLIAALTEASIAAPIVSNDQRSRRDGALDEPTERLGATVEHDGEPNASGIASVFPVVELGARLSMTHLDGTGDGNLVVNTTAFPTRSPANPGFVHLNMVLGLSTDPVLVGPHHARAELVENLKGRLVARKTKLPLKLHGGHAGRLTGDQISGPEPDVQRSVATLHHCSHRQPGVLAALAAAQDARAFQSGTALPPCRSAGRQSRLPSGLAPGRRRRPHHRGKVAGTRVANAGMGDRRGREHPWRAPLYPVCAHSSPSWCGCKPDKQGLMIDNTPEGLRIQVVDQDGLAMFPSGSSNMFLLTKKILELITKDISTQPQDLAIEGHTDAKKFGGSGAYTNWDLSADRANSARRQLVGLNIPEKRIGRVVGKAAKEPLMKDDPNNSRNRRLSIILLRGTGEQKLAKEKLPGLRAIRKKQLEKQRAKPKLELSAPKSSK